jgi:hypothetical protein
MAKRVDFLVDGHGSVFLLRAITRRARHWIDERVSADRQEWGGAVVVEPCYIGDVVRGAIADGLRVR